MRSGPGKSGGIGVVTPPLAAHSTPQASRVSKPMQFKSGLGSFAQGCPSIVNFLWIMDIGAAVFFEIVTNCMGLNQPADAVLSSYSSATIGEHLDEFPGNESSR
jgi:hypothetical protein